VNLLWGRRAGRSLLVSGVIVGLGIASVGVCVALLGGGPPFPVAVALSVLPVVIGAVATTSARARRAGTAILVAASDFAGLAVAVDLGLLLMLLAFGRLPVGAQLDLVDPALLGMLLVATCAGPLGRRIARATRSALSGVRRSPDELLADVGDRARRNEPVAELLRPLAESMRRDWRLSSVRIWTGPQGRLGEGDLECATIVPAPLDGAPPPIPLSVAERGLLARVGVAGPGWLRMWLPRLLPDIADPPQMRFAPAVDGSRVLALVVIERAADAAAFTGADERALAAVAGRLAIELRSRALDEALQATLVNLQKTNAELQASRTRIVAAATAERRRIERDLHDGAQQHLVALAVGLRLLRDGVPSDSPDVELLDELDRGAREAVAELRNLAHGIYPPLLRDAGLAAALRAVADRSPVAVTVVDDRPEHGTRAPEAVEVAVYFCCLEALQNVAKHAPEARVKIGLGEADGNLFFNVVDDGPGFDPATAVRGAGLQNMADRLGAVGGTLSIRSTPGQGTDVGGRVPVAQSTPTALRVG
jgi:signal transduction histidine kinase